MFYDIKAPRQVTFWGLLVDNKALCVCVRVRVRVCACVCVFTWVLHGGRRLVQGRGDSQEDLLPPGDLAGGRDLRCAYRVIAAGGQGPLPALPIAAGEETTVSHPHTAHSEIRHHDLKSSSTQANNKHP